MLGFISTISREMYEYDAAKNMPEAMNKFDNSYY